MALRSNIGFLRTLTATDALTGLANRRGFLASAARRHREASASGTPLALLLVDIDLFSSINAVYGRDTGNEAIVTVAAVVGATVGRHELMGRVGPDEIGVVVEADTDRAAALATALTQAVSTVGLAHAPGRTVTVSVGLACAEDDDDLESWMARAGRALRDAQTTGAGSEVRAAATRVRS